MATPPTDAIVSWLTLRAAADVASKAANEAKRELEVTLRSTPDLLVGSLLHDNPALTVWWRKMKKSENVTLTLLRKEVAEEMAMQIWSNRHSTDEPCLVVERKDDPATSSTEVTASSRKKKAKAGAAAEAGGEAAPVSSAKRAKKTKRTAEAGSASEAE